jgi:hypothetical protein
LPFYRSVGLHFMRTLTLESFRIGIKCFPVYS